MNQFFNDSTGAGDDGEVDARGPWNEGGELEFVDAPAFQEVRMRGRSGIYGKTPGEEFPASEMLLEELAACLQDLLHAEGQLVKALPKMVKAARAADLKGAFEQHLLETQGQVERLKEIFDLIGHKPKSKPCKGVAGLLEEGQEVIDDSRSKDDVAADLALIAAAQKVEHYEISSYISARALASHAGNSQAALLLNQTLLEEERTDKLLSRFATQLMELGIASEMTVGTPNDEAETEETSGEVEKGRGLGVRLAWRVRRREGGVLTPAIPHGIE